MNPIPFNGRAMNGTWVTDFFPTGQDCTVKQVSFIWLAWGWFKYGQVVLNHVQLLIFKDSLKSQKFHHCNYGLKLYKPTKNWKVNLHKVCCYLFFSTKIFHDYLSNKFSAMLFLPTEAVWIHFKHAMLNLLLLKKINPVRQDDRTEWCPLRIIWTEHSVAS